MTGAVLIALALIGMRSIRTAATIGVVCALTFAVDINGSSNVIFDLSNGYHRIRVVESGSVRSLYLDNTLEGQVRIGDVKPVPAYMVKAGGLIQEHAKHMEGRLESTFFLGGGSFSIPRYVKHLNPSADVKVAEVDPVVVDTASNLLELEDDFIDIAIGDGRQVLARDSVRYDVIVNDAFQGVRKIPFHLTTHEFNQVVNDLLSPNGIYMTNVRGDPRRSHLASSFVMTLSKTFPYIYAGPSSGINIWVVAAKRPLDWLEPIEDAGPMAQILTDDHAPIEYLIVRDFVAERVRRGT